MPLQKPPPKGHYSANRASAPDYQAELKHRRRTLQTIAELAPHPTASQGSIQPQSRLGNGTAAYGSGGNMGARSTTKSSRRRSLPIQGSFTGNDRATLPSMLKHRSGTPTLQRSVTEPHLSTTTSENDRATLPSMLKSRSGNPTLIRSVTDPNFSNTLGRNNPRRRSMPASFERHGRSLSPVAEAESSRYAATYDGLQQQQQLNRSHSHRSKSIDLKSAQAKRSEQIGWNAHRERELMKMEQALWEANARREEERSGFKAGDTARLPRSRSLHSNASNDSRQARYYTQPINNSQPTLIDATRRNSNGGHLSHPNVSEERLFTHSVPSTPNLLLNSYQQQRNQLIMPDPRCQSANDLINRTKSPGSHSSPSSSPSSSAGDPRSSSSLQTSSASTSSKSSVSGGSGGNKPTQRYPFLYASGANHPLRQNPTAGYQSAHSSLTEANLKSTGLSTSASHSSLRSRQSVRTSQSTNSRVIPRSPGPSTVTQERTHSRSRSQSQTQVRPQPSAIHHKPNSNDIIFRENPDKRGIANKRLTREEKGALDREATKEKIKERVRRANELEDEKERELVKEGKRKKKEKGNKFWSGVVCGLFKRRDQSA